MKEELPKIPFNLIHEFVGSLSIENYSVDNLHIVLRHSLLDTDQITCKIFGNNETAKNIKPILKKNTASIKLKSNSNFEIFESNGVAINNVTEFYSPSYENIIPNCIAKLSLLNLKISNYREWDGVKRNIKFYLSGPVDLIHQIFPFKFKKYKDPFKYEADKNYIGLFDGLKIYIIKFEFYDESLDDKIIRSKSIVALQVETDDVEISDEEFIKKAKIVIDDVLLLASFIGKNWISWYGYLFETNKIVQEYFQIRSRKINEKANFYDLIIPFYKIRQFLRSSYKKFKKHNDSGFNIKMVIIYIINGNESNYLEAQFTTTFLALEKLKDIYSIKYGLDINMKKNNFNKFKSKLSKFINGLDVINKDTVIEKLPELNRPPIKNILEKLLKDFEVRWEDLYPKGTDLTLIKTRNSLFHSSKHPDFDFIFKEYERLQILMNRIVLKILGWPDISNTTNIHVLEFLTKN